MRLLLTAGSLLLLASFSNAQSPVRLGLFGGVSQYQGDLQSSYFQGRFANAALGLTATYDIAPRFAVRAGLTFSALEASDRYNTKEELGVRNFSFRTRLTEFSLLGQYSFFNIEDTRWTPYVFAGVAVFKMDPYTYDSSGQKVYLRLLGTEGQGLEQYPGRKMYNKTQFAIPFGGGVTYAISERWQLGLELGIRKTFTDYIDDVSSTYADASDLLAGRGPKAVELAYRRGEVDPANAAYPEKGAMRGQDKWKDMYYFTGLHLQFRLGSGGGRGKYGCPPVGQ
jgi:opacity protein-like surface antigen